MATTVSFEVQSGESVIEGLARTFVMWKQPWNKRHVYVIYDVFDESVTDNEYTRCS